MRARGARAGPRLIARVQPLVTARSVDRTFDYGVPEGVELESGSRVLVPLGARQVDGVVVAVAEGDDDELKPIDEVIGRVPPALLELAVWMADEYGSTLARALALVIPPRPPKRALKARDDFPDPDVAVVRRLTDAQRAAVAGCLEAAAAGEREVLLHGVTGSGKTEVYLAVIERALEQGRGAVVLVPEIALTPQTAGRFVARFGDTVAVLHSALTPARRGAEHARIAAGEARVVVGARSAVFAAVPDLGVIVIDEEHDGSYKHESDPRYDARRVAAKRARIEGAIAIYGSATPRPEAWQGIRRRLELPARIGGLLPRVEVVDLRRDGGYPFTRPLLDALAGLDDRGGRAILLQNRRGAAAALHCRTCARSWRCPRCDVSLVLHGRALLVCHHCGLRERAPAACPACGSVDLARIGAGTERVELDLIERFPRLEVLRLDADVASRAGEPAATLDRFRAADRAVLVGTQIVAKGHDVPGVELAAVLDAETGLAVPDFRAEERTFALLTQLAGRPGRPGRRAGEGDHPGMGAGRPTGRAGRPPRRRRVPGRRARAPRRAGLPAVPAAGAAAGHGAGHGRRAGRRRGAGGGGPSGAGRGCAARAGADRPAPRPRAQPPAGEDARSAPHRGRVPRPAARPGAGHAPGGRHGRGRRRSADARLGHLAAAQRQDQDERDHPSGGQPGAAPDRPALEEPAPLRPSSPARMTSATISAISGMKNVSSTASRVMPPSYGGSSGACGPRLVRRRRCLVGTGYAAPHIGQKTSPSALSAPHFPQYIGQHYSRGWRLTPARPRSPRWRSAATRIASRAGGPSRGRAAARRG